MKDLGIVICNFNKVEYLKGCLETLYESDFETLSYDVIVVDNASTDESVEFVKKNYSLIILLQNETNTGGSGGFDRGIQYVMKQNYTYVALLDNDILLENDTILNLIKYIKENTKVGVVGSKICTMDNPEILQEMGSFIDYENKFNIYTPLKSHKDDDSLPDVVVCDYVPACCMITTNEVLKKVGSFNIDHFIYWDDMDWCTRVKKSGWEIHAINSSRVFHKMGTSDNKNTFGMYYFHRNRILYFIKYLNDQKFEKFINNISEWILSVTFFSNLKEDYNTAQIAWLLIDDLKENNLGIQEDRILVRNNSLRNFNLKDEFIFLISDNNIENISSFLKRFYKNITIIQNKDLVLSNMKNKIVFKEVEHIVDILNIKIYQNMSESKIIYIDKYFNTCSNDEILDLIKFYDMYKKLFKNIYFPIISEKLKLVRKNLV